MNIELTTLLWGSAIVCTVLTIAYDRKWLKVLRALIGVALLLAYILTSPFLFSGWLLSIVTILYSVSAIK
jgi:hypothetical protein